MLAQRKRARKKKLIKNKKKFRRLRLLRLRRLRLLRPLRPLSKFDLFKRLIFKILKNYKTGSLPASLRIFYKRKYIKFLKKKLKIKIKRFVLTHHPVRKNRNFRVYKNRVRKNSRSVLFPYRFFMRHKKSIRKLFGTYRSKRSKIKKKVVVVVDKPAKPKFKSKIIPYLIHRIRIEKYNQKHPNNKKKIPKKKINFGRMLHKLHIGSKRASRNIKYWIKRQFNNSLKPYIKRLIRVLVYIRAYRNVTPLKKPGWKFLPPEVRFLYRKLSILAFKNHQSRRSPRPDVISYRFPKPLFIVKHKRVLKSYRRFRVKRVLERIFSGPSRRPNIVFDFEKSKTLSISFKKSKLKIKLKRRRSQVTNLSFKKSTVTNSTRRVPRKFFSLLYRKQPAFKTKFANYFRSSKYSNVILRFFRRRLPYYKRKVDFRRKARNLASKIHFFWVNRTNLKRKRVRKGNHFIRTRYARYQPFLGVFRSYSKPFYLYKRRRQKFFRYFNRLFSTRSFYYGISNFKKDLIYRKSDKTFFIHIFKSVNNIFVNFTTKLGRSVFVYSSGRGFFKGSKRLSPVAVEAMGKQVSSLIKSSKIKAVGVVFHTNLDFLVKALLRGLRINVAFTSFKYHLTRPHNGLRKPASRRI